MTMRCSSVHAWARAAGVVLVLAGLGGCAQPGPPPLYQWGSYESQLYAMYVTPDKTSTQDQVSRLEADYQRARAANQAVPPGFHAHLGFLYFQLGRADQALQSFQTEAALFPESKPYMERLVNRVKTPPSPAVSRPGKGTLQ